MDERVKETYRKIYAELFSLILFGCCLSVIIKIAFLGMDVTACIPEYPILVGSPVYLLVRSRMLGVTQADFLKSKTKRNHPLTIVCALLLSLLVFTAIARNHGEPVNWKTVLGFGVPFVICFALGQLGFRKLEERRQKKLDSKYDE